MPPMALLLGHPGFENLYHLTRSGLDMWCKVKFIACGGAKNQDRIDQVGMADRIRLSWIFSSF